MPKTQKTMSTGHGNHWECLGKPVEDLIEIFIPKTLARGEIAGSAKRTGQWFEMIEPAEQVLTSIVYAPTDLGSMVIVVSNHDREGVTLLTAFPYAVKAPRRRVTITEIRNWDGHAEGVLVGEVGDAAVAFFDTHFFVNQDIYKIGEEYDFRLAGLIYKARCTNDETVLVENPETIAALRSMDDGEPEMLPDGSLAPVTVHLAGCAGLAPTSGDYPDDAEFYCVIKAVKELRLEGIRIFQITPDLGDVALPAVIFGEASKFENGYEPKVGDSIGGGLWMQGYLDDRVKAKSA
jgi:hypothetical protein